MAKIIEVIEVFEERGDGKSIPTCCRTVRQLWSKTGELIFEDDPVNPTRTKEEAIYLVKQITQDIKLGNGPNALAYSRGSKAILMKLFDIKDGEL